MADNGNRGPNDFRSRNGKKRREPPIIDASAVPLDDSGSTTDEPPATDSDLARTGEIDPASGEPVLFGSAVRPTAARDSISRDTPPDNPLGARSADEPWVSRPADEPSGEPAASSSEPASAMAEMAARDADAAAIAAPSTSGSAAEDGSRARHDAPLQAAARSGGGALTGMLGVACLVLLGVIAWLVAAGPRRADQDAMAASVADLKSKVAALEARPDPAEAQVQTQGSLTALDKRVAAGDADRTALAKTMAGLSTRLDSVAQTARENAAKADATPVSEPPQPSGPAFATADSVAALSAKVDGLDKSLATVTDDQGRTAKAIADLPKPVAPDFGPVDAKVAAFDTRLTTLDGKLNASDARFNAFDAKVNGVEGKVNGFDARMNGLDGRLNAIEATADAAAAQAVKLQGTVANLPKVDLAPLQASIQGLDGRVAKMEGQLGAPKDGARVTEARAVGSADETKATPIALVGQSIASAIADGRPYGPDLDALKALGADPDAIAKLTPMAASGAPTPALLKERWEAVEGDVLAALKPADAGGGSALDRFAASARNLVQVRRVGAVGKGDDASATVLAVDAALSSGDIPGALAAWTRLPAAGQDKSRDWAAAARNQIDATSAAQALVGRAIATLGRSKS